MLKASGQFATQTAPGAPTAPAALARAWQALALYGPAHAAVQQRLAEFCEATAGLSAAIRMYAEPGRMVHAGAALEPRDLFAPLADVLQRAGLAIMDLRGRVELEHAQQLLRLLADSRGGDADVLAALPRGIAEATAGAVRVFTLSAEHLRIRAVAPNAGGGGGGGGGGGETNRRGIALHELDRQDARPRNAAKADVPAALDHAAVDPAVSAVLDMCAPCEAVSPEAADLETVRAAVASLSPEQRRQLLEALGHDSDVPFEEAARILSLMPVRDVTDAIAVLERSDSRLSMTALMLLRRLAHLSLGSEIDLGRLARVAEDWAAGEAELGEAAGLARTTSELLTRLNESEFRSEEYSELLQQLSAEQPGAYAMTCTLAADDLAGAQQRVVEIVCEALTCPGVDLDASAPLRFLRERCAAAADLGDTDMAQRVMGVANTFLAPQRKESERKSARSLLDAAVSERWTARAIAGTAEEGRVRGVIEGLRTSKEPAIDAYVAALCVARSRRRYRTLVSCRDMFTSGELKQAIVRCIAGEPRFAGALAPFIHEASPADLIELLTPALLHLNDEVRRQAFAALERLGVEWRDDLYVRGALDEDEQVRLATIRAIGRGGGRHARLLIDRLAGRIGSAACTEVEVEALQIALKNERGGGATTRIALTLCMLSLWPMRSKDGGALASALRVRPRTPLSLVALLVCKVSPLQIVHRRWSRKGGGDDA